MTYMYVLELRQFKGGRDSSVGIAIRYRLDAQGIESRWDENFPKRLDPPWGPTSLL